MTQLKYLTDTYLFESSATVVTVEETLEGQLLILDQTIFYPQGGGQPFDLGSIAGEQWVFSVKAVRLSPEGDVLHYGTTDGRVPQTGDPVRLVVDSRRRIMNASAHSAGHILDVALVRAGVTGLRAGKGYHFPEGPYVEYLGQFDPGQIEGAMKAISAETNQLILENRPILATDLSEQEARSRKIVAPVGKSVRFVHVEGYEQLGCGCGGTHVARTGEVEGLMVRKMSSKKGIVRVSYSLN